MTNPKNKGNPAIGQGRARRPLVSVWLFVLILIGSGASRTRIDRMKSALGCLLSQTSNQDVLRDLGLRLRDFATVRLYVGSIPGLQPSPGVYTLMLESSDHSRAWLLAAIPHSDGKFESGDDAFQLRWTGTQWSVEEGWGGLATYRAMGKFANWLSRNRPAHRLPLKAQPEFCSVRKQ